MRRRRYGVRVGGDTAVQVRELRIGGQCRQYLRRRVADVDEIAVAVALTKVQHIVVVVFVVVVVVQCLLKAVGAIE